MLDLSDDIAPERKWHGLQRQNIEIKRLRATSFELLSDFQSGHLGNVNPLHSCSIQIGRNPNVNTLLGKPVVKVTGQIAHSQRRRASSNLGGSPIPESHKYDAVSNTRSCPGCD